MSALLVMLGFVPLVTLLTAVLWPKGDATWGKRLLLADAGESYRTHALVRWTRSSEPRLVRVTSALTAFLGGMAFPGGFAGIVGLFATVAMLSGKDLSSDPALILTVGLAASVPTGLVVAFRCFRLFGAILENRDGTTTRMRRLARFSLIHNTAVALVWIMFLVRGGDASVAVFSLYVLVSFIHVVLLKRAAAAMDQQREESARCEQILATSGANVRVEELPPWKADGPGVAAEPVAEHVRARG